jgi:hypothetical protein
MAIIRYSQSLKSFIQKFHNTLYNMCISESVLSWQPSCYIVYPHSMNSKGLSRANIIFQVIAYHPGLVRRGIQALQGKKETTLF